MKFTDGYWLLRSGISALFPAHVYDVEIKDNELWVYAPARLQEKRGDDFDMPLLTLRITSPMSNVIRVQVIHHKGMPPRHPHFELNIDPETKVEIEETEDAVSFTSGALSINLPKSDEWRMDFIGDGKQLTTSGRRGLGYFENNTGERFVREQLELGIGELVYGLGERFTPFVKNGQTVDIWNEDGGTRSDQAYKNIPFYLTNRGYGVFVNQPERVSFEIATEDVERIQFGVPGEQLDYFLIYGPTSKEVLHRYTALTGRPALPPAWSFGLWLSTSGTTDYDEPVINQLVQRMTERDIPLSVLHIDPYWMKAFHWTNFEWDPNTFPNPKAFLKRMHDRDLRVCLWMNPYIAQRSSLFDEGMQKGYLVKRADGSVWQWDRWQGGMALVDFTNPAARTWFAEKIKPLLEIGVDALKTDFGERIPTDVVYHDGSDPQRMHNYYTYLYNETVFNAIKEVRGEGDAVVFARSATTGGQKFPVHWGGDNSGSFASMAESLRGGLSLSLSGFGFWSHDIGGYDQTAPAEVYKRWAAFGLLSSHSRLHGSTSYRVPWEFGEEAVDVVRFFTKLKCQLMPYIFNAARIAHEQGIPVMRPMVLEFPDDPGCETLDRQYMLGDSLLVAPIFGIDDEVSYYVPEGRWTNLISGEIVQGPGWKREKHGFLSLPLLVRPGAVLPFGAMDNKPDYDFADGVNLRIYQFPDGEERVVEIPDLTGKVQATFTINRKGQELNIERKGRAAAKPWTVELMGYHPPAFTKGGATKPGMKSVVIAPAKGAKELVVSLHAGD